MKKVGKVVLYAVTILLLGVFSQEGIRAEEADGKRYSRTYSVLSANVGNSYVRLGFVELLKLQPGSDEAIKVAMGIKLLKPDIMVLIEAYDKDQVEDICSSTGESYFVSDGQYDFVCVKDSIIAKSDGKPDINYTPMPGSEDNSVGYVDVGLKDENGRKVRLFYVHFPSPSVTWELPEHEEHKKR